MALTKRLVKGSPLTFQEGDDNLDYLEALATNTGSFVTTSSLSGSPNYIPVFTGTNSVSSSILYQSGSNIGIGTTTPSYSLDISGTIRGSADAIINGLTVGKGFTNNASATAFGVDANLVNTSLFSTAFGYQASRNNTSGGITAIGYQAGFSNTTGESNIAIGYQSLYSNTTSSWNTAVGSNCMTFATGQQNSGFGYQVLDNVTGRFNVGMGYRSLRYLTSGEFNTAIGGTSSNNIGTGGFNTTIGYGALAFGTQGNANSNNTVVGYSSLSQVVGDNNTSLGFQAGRYIANGSTNVTALNNSILIGYNTKVLANSQTNQIVIGYDETGLGSNTTIIGNSSTVTTAIRGNLLLGTTTDAGYKLDVAGTTRFTGNSLISGSLTITGSLIAPTITGSLNGTASWASEAVTASYVLNAVSSSFATTASFALNVGDGGGGAAAALFNYYNFT